MASRRAAKPTLRMSASEDGGGVNATERLQGARLLLHSTLLYGARGERRGIWRRNRVEAEERPPGVSHVPNCKAPPLPSKRR